MAVARGEAGFWPLKAILVLGRPGTGWNQKTIQKKSSRSNSECWSEERSSEKTISHERSSEESAGQKSDHLPAKLFLMIDHREGGCGCQKIIIVMN